MNRIKLKNFKVSAPFRFPECEYRLLLLNTDRDLSIYQTEIITSVIIIVIAFFLSYPPKETLIDLECLITHYSKYPIDLLVDLIRYFNKFFNFTESLRTYCFFVIGYCFARIFDSIFLIVNRFKEIRYYVNHWEEDKKQEEENQISLLNAKCATSLVAESYNIYHFNGDVTTCKHIYSLELNRIFDTSKIDFEIIQEKYYWRTRDFSYFILEKKWKKYRIDNKTGKVVKQKKELYNKKKVRLYSNIFDICKNVAQSKVFLQKVEYYQHETTNKIATKYFVDKIDGSVCDGLQLCYKDGTLLELDASLCSNEIGISSLAITADNFLVVNYQSKNNLNNEGRLAPSGSGSIDWDEIKSKSIYRFSKRKSGNFVEIIKQSTNNRLLFELGLIGSWKLNFLYKYLGEKVTNNYLRKYIFDTKVIGFCRLVEQGGLPEFFSISKLNIILAQLSREIDHHESSMSNVNVRYNKHEAIIKESNVYPLSNVNNNKDLKTSLEQIEYSFQAGQHEVSHQLHLNIKFLKQYIEYQDSIGNTDFWRELITVPDQKVA